MKRQVFDQNDCVIILLKMCRKTPTSKQSLSVRANKLNIKKKKSRRDNGRASTLIRRCLFKPLDDNQLSCIQLSYNKNKIVFTKFQQVLGWWSLGSYLFIYVSILSIHASSEYTDQEMRCKEWLVNDLCKNRYKFDIAICKQAFDYYDTVRHPVNIHIYYKNQCRD